MNEHLPIVLGIPILLFTFIAPIILLILLVKRKYFSRWAGILLYPALFFLMGATLLKLFEWGAEFLVFSTIVILYVMHLTFIAPLICTPIAFVIMGKDALKRKD